MPTGPLGGCGYPLGPGGGGRWCLLDPGVGRTQPLHHTQCQLLATWVPPWAHVAHPGAEQPRERGGSQARTEGGPGSPGASWAFRGGTREQGTGSEKLSPGPDPAAKQVAGCEQFPQGLAPSLSPQDPGQRVGVLLGPPDHATAAATPGQPSGLWHPWEAAGPWPPGRGESGGACCVGCAALQPHWRAAWVEVLGAKPQKPSGGVEEGSLTMAVKHSPPQALGLQGEGGAKPVPRTPLGRGAGLLALGVGAPGCGGHRGEERLRALHLLPKSGTHSRFCNLPSKGGWRGPDLGGVLSGGETW